MLYAALSLFSVLSVSSILLLIMLNSKYIRVKAVCIEPSVAQNSEMIGFSFFEYKHDYGDGERKYFYRVKSISRPQKTKNYTILIVKHAYDERGIMFLDVVKLVGSLMALGTLILITISL